MKRTLTELSAARRLLTLAGVVTTLVTATPLLAETDSARARARAHFDQGVALGKQRAYREALAEFQLAYDAFPNHGVLYNIGQALIRLDRHSEAVATLERYLFEGGAELDPKRQREVEATLLSERAKTGSILVSVVPSGALIVLDDRPVAPAALSAPLRVDPGTHRLRASLEAGPTREVTVEVAAQQVQQVHLDLTPPQADAPGASPPPTPRPALPRVATTAPVLPAAPLPARAPEQRMLRSVGYVLGAAGIALAGGAVGHYLWNRGRYEDWQARSSDYYRDPTDENREAANSLGRSIPAASVVTVGLAIGAGVALGTGVALVVTASPGQHPSGGRAGGVLIRARGEF